MKLNDLWQVWPVKFHKSPQPGRVRGKTSMKLNDLWQVWPVKFHKSSSQSMLRRLGGVWSKNSAEPKIPYFSAG